MATYTDGAWRKRATTLDRRLILVIEADPDLGQGIVDQLVADNHPAKLVRSANHAELLADRYPPRLVVLGELDSPRGALDLLRKIRAGRPDTAPWPADVPVIVVSSRTHETDILRAYESGADDFLARPAKYLELRSRLRAILRRSGSSRGNRVIQVGPLLIDTDSRAASLNGKQLDLRRLEYELLVHLASDPQRVFQKQELLSKVWGYRGLGTTRTLDSHASRLRRKLSVGGGQWVINARGVGYRLI